MNNNSNSNIQNINNELELANSSVLQEGAKLSPNQNNQDIPNNQNNQNNQAHMPPRNDIDLNNTYKDLYNQIVKNFKD